VAGVVKDDQPAGEPYLMEPPGGIGRAGDVVGAVDENPMDRGQAVHADKSSPAARK
jgi:hypothetical protein